MYKHIYKRNFNAYVMSGVTNCHTSTENPHSQKTKWVWDSNPQPQIDEARDLKPCANEFESLGDEDKVILIM